MRFPSVLACLCALTALSTTASAQQQGFAVLRRADTVAIERFERGTPKWSGTLEIRKQPRSQYEVWSVIRGPESGVVLMEVTEKEAAESPKHKPRIIQEARLIFKDDSVAIDAVTNGGLMTRLYQTRKGAMPYLNLSFATIELLVDEARKLQPKGAGPVPVALFNLMGGQTADATVSFSGDGATVQVGKVTIACVLLPDGRIRTATIAAQELRAERLP
ncbi:MAG TPA: hypothetical protein VFY20_09630 [Gemmatimonadales bacterium]|nr:hypothetical protein [Gemmatimonadales bacterium]